MNKMSQKAIYKLIYTDVLQKIRKKIEDKKLLEKLSALQNVFS